jgi:hypothetical protein
VPLKARVQVRNRVGISHSIFLQKNRALKVHFQEKEIFTMGLILGVCFMVICFMYYATCKKMSAEINDLRKKADDYYDAICLLKEECNPVGQSVQQDALDNVDNIEA